MWPHMLELPTKYKKELMYNEFIYNGAARWATPEILETDAVDEVSKTSRMIQQRLGNRHGRLRRQRHVIET